MIAIIKCIDNDRLNLAKFWLEYIPEWWHLDELLSKKARDLSIDELNILLRAKIDKRMLDDVERFKNMAICDREVPLCEDDADRLDRIYAYLDNNEGFLKISEEERNYVAMIYNEYRFNDSRMPDETFNSAAWPYLEAYSNSEMPTLFGKSTKRPSGSSRAKKPHSVYPRIPNRIK